jgi:hypothetical protein
MNLTPEEAWKIKDPVGVWYGPHECNGCGATIIKLSLEQGGISLNAPHDHHYPNHVWQKHSCAEHNALKQGVVIKRESPREIIEKLNEQIKEKTNCEIRWVGFPEGIPYVARKTDERLYC